MIKKIVIILGWFLFGLALSQILGWWILYFIGMIADIMVENIDN